MYIDRETKEKMDTLSTHVWGSKSAWQTYLKKGIKIPSDQLCGNPKHPAATTYNYYTVETIHDLMQSLLKQMQESLVKKV